MKYAIEFSLEQVRVVISALQELPYKVSKPVIDSILEQAGKQEMTNVSTEVKEPKEIKKPIKKE